MNPVRTGQVMYCENCGVELKVTKDCNDGCTCVIECCKQPMSLKAEK